MIQSGKLQAGRRRGWQICSVRSFTHASLTVCRRWHFICFPSLMACRWHVGRVSFCHRGFLCFLSLTAASSAKEKGSGDPATPISLETDEAAARLLLLLPFLSSLLLHPPPPPSVNDVFVPAVTNTTLCNFSRSTREGVGLF